MRIAQPASKRKTAQLAVEYGFDCSLDRVYKLMDRLTDQFILGVKKTIYDKTAMLLAERKKTIDVLFYDLTTVYFETSTQDELRNFGFSKDGKHQHVQIMLAVIVTKDGLPIDYEEFTGNCYEGHTLIPVLEKIKPRYNIDKVVLVADAALMNKLNLQQLTKHGIQFVIAARIKKLNQSLTDQALQLDSFELLHTARGENDVPEDIVKSKTIPLEAGESLVAFHSSKRARKDAHDREKDLDKIKHYLHSTAKSQLTSRLKKPYVKISKSAKIELDEVKLKREQRYDGLFALHTNIPTPKAQDLLFTYRGLWQVEQTFRIVKSNLELRPVFHYTPRRIKAHFVICYMALAVMRYVEFTLKQQGLHFPCDKLHLLLDRMRLVRIVNSHQDLFEFLEDPPNELVSVYQALNLKWRAKFSHSISL